MVTSKNKSFYVTAGDAGSNYCEREQENRVYHSFIRDTKGIGTSLSEFDTLLDGVLSFYIACQPGAGKESGRSTSFSSSTSLSLFLSPKIHSTTELSFSRDL